MRTEDRATSARAPHPGTIRGGFTILELIVLLAVLSVVASVAIPAYFGRADVTLDNAAKLLAKDFREVQNRAALYEESLWIRFDAAGHGYKVTDASDEALISPYGNGDYARHYPFDAVFRGVSISRIEPHGTKHAIFDSAGRPLEGLSVTLEYEGQMRTVSLRARSGLISIDGLDEPWVDFGH